MQNPLLFKLTELEREGIFFSINHQEHTNQKINKEFYFEKEQIDFELYQKAFDWVKQNILLGNSFLVNLSAATPIQTNLSLAEIFEYSQAKYKLLWKDKFVCFSPEIFIQIQGNQIASFPMKGTIDASIPNAQEIILNDLKETAEHHTIVDLIRNDLSKIAENVRVEKFRYLDKIAVHQNTLWQVSSKITADLPANWQANLGELLFSLLPAGSICGAPKTKTLEIIKEAESHFNINEKTYQRGYYTGILGVFDGENLDCGVMIRFIENIDKQLYFKSGGGITAMSEVQSEYEELNQKIYVPIFGKHQSEA